LVQQRDCAVAIAGASENLRGFPKMAIPSSELLVTGTSAMAVWASPIACSLRLNPAYASPSAIRSRADCGLRDRLSSS